MVLDHVGEGPLSQGLHVVDLRPKTEPGSAAVAPRADDVRLTGARTGASPSRDRLLALGCG